MVDYFRGHCCLNLEKIQKKYPIMKILSGFIILGFIVLIGFLCTVAHAEISESKAFIDSNSSNNSSKWNLESNVTNTYISESSTPAPQEETFDIEPPNEDISHLVAANVALAVASRIAILENRLRALEGLLVTVNHDVNFHHPTKEIQFVDMQVVQWEDALESGLRNVAIPFQAGYSIGAVSSWEFSLGSENEAVAANLVLFEERYNRGALFAGFTAFVLDDTGNVYSEAFAAPVNFLDGSGRTLHLPNIVSLGEIRNASNGLLEGGVFRIRFRLELLGVGQKLYSGVTVIPSEPSPKDVQTVVFDVEDIFSKMQEQQNSTRNTNSSNRDDKPFAFTRFILKHDLWFLTTHWAAELHKGDDNAISLHVILEHCGWSQLYSSFRVEVWELQDKKLLQAQGTPINNFVQDRITIDPLLLIPQLQEAYDEESPLLQFKLQFTVFGRNARYYTDVI